MCVRLFVSVRYSAELLIDIELSPVKVGKVLGTVKLIVTASIIYALNEQMVDRYCTGKQFAERFTGLSRNRIVVSQILRQEPFLMLLL